MILKEAAMEDLKGVATCHRLAFPHSFSTRLGLSYLTQMYEWYLASPNTFLVLAKENEHVLGFAGGFLKDGETVMGSASSMVQYSFGAGIKAVVIRPWLLFHPDLLSKYRFIARNIISRLRKTLLRSDKIVQMNKRGKPQAGLVVIAVEPYFQKKGLGSQLLRQFEILSLQRGFSNLQLTVHVDNEQAIQAYTKNGWHITGQNRYDIIMEKAL